MKSENYFIKKLEEQLSDSENIKLFREMKDGKNNQELILLRNLNLVKIVVENYDTRYDKDELFQIGVLELMDSINKFDCDKRKSFTRYAIKNIKKRIAEVLNNLPNNELVVNYGHITDIDDEFITDIDTNVEEDYEKKELRVQVRDYVNSLSQIPRECIKMYFGFYGKQYSFEEIALIFNMPRNSIKRIIVRELMTIRRLISTKKIDKVINSIQKRK